MPIISQETWEKMTDKERSIIIDDYNKMLKGITEFTEEERNGAVRQIEWLIGKENLQPKPKIRTWEDLVKCDLVSPLVVRESAGYAIDACGGKIGDKVEATLKIAKLIEFGYGGMVSEEEWTNNHIPKFYIGVDYRSTNWLCNCDTDDDYHFIAFHTPEQRQEFMSYSENIELVHQYYMI